MDNQQKVINIKQEQLGESVSVSVGELVSVLNMIDGLSRRGAFVVDEYTDIGRLYGSIKSSLYNKLNQDQTHVDEE